MLDLIIKNGLSYIDKDLKSKDIAIKDGKIVEIGKINSEAKEIFDAKGLTVLPGCIIRHSKTPINLHITVLY